MKKFLVLLLLTLILPIKVKSNHKPAHDICIKASENKGCINVNGTYSNDEKVGAIALIGTLICMERKYGVSSKLSDEQQIKQLNEVGINPNIRFDSDVKPLAKEYSYLVDQENCLNMKFKDERKFYGKVIKKLKNRY